MNPRAIGLSVAGLLVAGGVIAGATGAQAETSAGPAADHPRAIEGATTPRATQVVTGPERERVAAAIRQRDASVTVHAVRRGADGLFHALGAKDGEPVLAEVSKSYQQVTLQERPGP